MELYLTKNKISMATTLKILQAVVGRIIIKYVYIHLTIAITITYMFKQNFRHGHQMEYIKKDL